MHFPVRAFRTNPYLPVVILSANSFLQDCLGLLREVVETEGGVAVDKIILCGAVARTPALQTAVRNAFPKAQMLESIAQDEVFAYGCAVRIFGSRRVCQSGRSKLRACACTPVRA